jgi:phosphoglycolate phosphatase
MTYLLRNVIFDLDGTLVDSANDIRSAIAQAYAAIGMEGMSGKIEQIVIGPPLAETVRCLTPDLAAEDYSALVANFRQAYDSSPLTETEVYAGVREVLQQLLESNATLLVATNKPAFATRRVLAKTGLQDCFRDVVTPDTCPSAEKGTVPICAKHPRPWVHGARRSGGHHVPMVGGLSPFPPASKAEMVRHLIEKWSLDREGTFVFGDAVSDVEAAQRNGVGSAAILSGYGNREELTSSRPTVLLESIGELWHCGQFHL